MNQPWIIVAGLLVGSLTLLLLGRRASAQGRVWSRSFYVYRAERPDAFRFTVALYFAFAGLMALIALVVALTA